MWGKGHEFAGDPHKTQHISAPRISQKSKIFDCFSVLWCDCHWQSMDFDSLRGAPPQGEAFVRSRATAVNDHLQDKAIQECKFYIEQLFEKLRKG